MIQPPNSRWRENLQEAVKCGAAGIILEVLKLHQGKPDAVEICLECLTKLAMDAHAAEGLADEGIDALFDIINDPTSPPVRKQFIRGCVKVI